ncbi:fatty acyl-CoA reductase 1-like [Cimex lectularius]|uniref:Fatty acyl-CoA reductase n=1 Tax=Cimex lectularius TaxID=79782 RepID=A0A8I6R8X3_CIMLE|nr:fatty acyl-CoA reductase 1-like [Cimex lectularius]
MDELTIPEYFAGKNVLVTGGTGFMGKVLIEKLLRSCPDVNTIYVLVRPKKGKTAQERWDAATQVALFDKLRQTMPEQLKRVYVVEGDIDKPDLGLSQEKKQLLKENVHFLYHAAAAVQFTEDLIYSFRENTYGTYLVAELAKSMKHLKCFIHVSTAYSNCNMHCKNVLEEIYPLDLNWKPLIDLHKSDPRTVAILKDKVMCGHPTTYTLTKGLAEQVMNDYSQYYPVIVIRPSLVLATLNDPMEGWVDMLNGLTTLILAVGAGVLRIIIGRKDSCLDFVSVDHSIKCFIIATYLEGKKNRTNGIEVVSCNYSDDLNLKLSEITEECHDFVCRYPLEECLWAPSSSFVTNKFLFGILFFLFQIIPAILVDTFLIVKGDKPRLMKLTIKMAQAFNGPISFFSTNVFCFPNHKFKTMSTYLHPKDMEDFSYDFARTDTKKIVDINTLGTYKYHLKLSTEKEHLEKLRKRHQRMLYIHYAVCAFLCFLCGYSLLTVMKYIYFKLAV